MTPRPRILWYRTASGSDRMRALKLSIRPGRYRSRFGTTSLPEVKQEQIEPRETKVIVLPLADIFHEVHQRDLLDAMFFESAARQVSNH